MNRRTKHLTALIVFWVASYAQGATLPHAAVCRVSNQVGNSTNYGSGTLVSRDKTTAIVVTCWHIFRDEGVGKVKVAFRKSCHYGRVVGKNPAFDLAAIHIARPDVAPAPLATVWPRGGDTVHWAGYGPVGKYAAGTGRVTRYMRTIRTGANETLELTGHAQQGDSGGPIFNEQGQLVAVLWGTDGRTIGGTYGGRVFKFLRKCRPGVICSPPNPRWKPSPSVAAAPPIPSAPTRPLVPVQPPAVTIKPARPASGDLAAIKKEIAGLRAAIAQLKTVAGPQGEPGETGEPGPPGPRGSQGDTTEVDYDKITAAVVSRLPPMTFQTERPDGTVIKRIEVGLGGIVPFTLFPIGGE